MSRSGQQADLLYMVIFKAKGDIPIGAMGLAPSLAKARETRLPEKGPEPEEKKKPAAAKNTFAALHDEASEAVTSLRALHRVTVMIASVSTPLQFKFTLEPALKEHGNLVFTDQERDIYELHRSHAREIVGALRNAASGIKSADDLPKLLLTALISDYDVFLQKLIKAAFTAQPQLQSGIQRSLSLGELTRFSNIDEAYEFLIEREIDAILHEDHLQHLRALNKLFNIKIELDDDRVKAFLEVCERRNLFTHNAGIINSRYLNRCIQLGIDVSKLKQGDHLDASDEYLKEALLLSHELKIKLCQYVWRKLLPAERASADDKLNDAGFTLLQVDEYLLAERILEYGIKHTGKTEEKTRLMMIVNHANALRLGGKKRRAVTELDKIDWSASSDLFQISVAAVKDDLASVLRLLDGAVKGGALKESDVRTWPVFKSLRGEKQFQDRFKEIFKSDLIAVPSLVATTEAPPVLEPKATSRSTKSKRMLDS